MSGVSRAALFLVLCAVGAEAGEEPCRSDQQCPPWQQCTVSLGDCGGGDSPLDVCTGTCVAGERWRFVGRLSGGAFLKLEPAVALEVEAAAPVLAGAPSIVFGIIPLQRAVRLGVGAAAGFKGLRAGVQLSALGAYVAHRAPVDSTSDSGRRVIDPALLASARIELFPWALWDFVTPFHHLSVFVDGGAGLQRTQDLTTVSPHLSLGFGWWI